MVYNNPATANVDMQPELIARIAEIPNCLYVKESTLDPTRVRDIIRLAGDKMTVFAGVLGYESFWLGAEGWVAVCSNVIPRWSAELFELVADKRDMDAALALYMKMTPLLLAGRRPALRLRYQGRLRDDGHADGPAARAAPAAARGPASRPA